MFSDYWFLMRYAIVGACGGGIQTATLYTWVEFFHLEKYYIFGSIIGFCLALLVTFTLQKYWTFRDRAHSQLKKQFFFYTSIAITNLTLNIFFLHTSKVILEALGLDFFHIWYLIVQVGIVVLLAGLSFMANYLFTFNRNIPEKT